MHRIVQAAAIVSFAGVAATLVLQVTATGQVGANIDSTTIFLLLFAVALLFVAVAPTASSELLQRVTTLKLPGGIEVGMQAAAARVENLEAQLPEATDEVKTSPVPQEGGPREQYDAIRDKLQERLRFVNAAVLGKEPDYTNYKRIIERIEEQRLLAGDELRVVRDVLGGSIEGSLFTLQRDARDQYFEGSWRFAVRFGTLCFERLVRRNLARAGWFLLDFEQAKSHRPDFLAYRNDRWRLIAARVEPTKTKETRERLLKLETPFDAERLLLVPDSRPYEPDDEYKIEVKTLSELLADG